MLCHAFQRQDHTEVESKKKTVLTCLYVEFSSFKVWAAEKTETTQKFYQNLSET